MYEGRWSGTGRARALVVLGTTVLAALLALWLPSCGDEAGDGGSSPGPWQRDDAVVSAMNRGVAWMEQYDYAKAVQAFEEALARAPKDPDVRVNLAIAAFNRNAKGDLEKGAALLAGVLADHPDHTRALYMRGILHQYAGQDDKAVGFFERVVEQAPEDAYALYFLARSYVNLERPARAPLERAIAANPALVSAYYLLMQVAARGGQEKEADRLQEKFLALRENPLAEAVVSPQYHRMGPLALARPIAKRPDRPVTGGELKAGQARVVLAATAPIEWPLAGEAVSALADVNGDGHLDLLNLGRQESAANLLLFLGAPGPSFRDATKGSGLDPVVGAISAAFGDYDNDDVVDLFVCCNGPDRLMRGKGDGTFEDVTVSTGVGGDGASFSAVFLDADHDGDLDLYVCRPGANSLWNNNADGTFVDIAVSAGVACEEDGVCVMMAPADLDGDRDTDLVVFFASARPRVFLNDRLGHYHAVKDWLPGAVGCLAGGVVQDFNGDARPDVLIAPGPASGGRLYLSTPQGAYAASEQFNGASRALRSHGPAYDTKVGDYDLDGDLDIVCFAGPEPQSTAAGHLLRNDGWGRFSLVADLWPQPADGALAGTRALLDLTGDGVADLLRTTTATNRRLELVPGVLTPPAHWLAVSPTGHRGKDGRTRSPASGYGVRMQLRTGLHTSTVTFTGLDGGFCQSHRPFVFGLNGASQPDFLALRWTDGVTQAENGLKVDSVLRLTEMEKKVSSCPVLFTWNGERFEYITDFAGVGGLGYFLAPGVYAPPQIRELVKIGAGQLQPRKGHYELRFCEPMEEVAYLDRIELVAVDHPQAVDVFPDERLVLEGPAPTQKLLAVRERHYPVTARGPDGQDCAQYLRDVDRKYAYRLPLDRRFIGFCEEHALELDFGAALGALPKDKPIHLYLTASIEYPYSQTTYAAGQAQVAWEAPKLERRKADGTWEILVADTGAPGGTARTICVDLTGKLRPTDRILRLRTNLELYYDRVFIAVDRGLQGVTQRTVRLTEAKLRRLGFPQEVSPDGRHPTIYDYGRIEPTSSFKLPLGSYTRYGDVADLLAAFDDRYVVFGTGDEIAARFDATALPPLPKNYVRSFVLISHGYCKDMDLYTATPDTVEPLPFQTMSRYPYPAEEMFPQDPVHTRYRREWNTRVQSATNAYGRVDK